MRKLLFLKQLKVKHVRVPPVDPRPDRAGLAIVAMLRDEAHYAVDWARFHLRAGARRLIVYDNGSRDGTPDLLRAAIPDDRLILYPWAGAYVDDATEIVLDRQCLAYAHAVHNHGADVSRMAFIDGDEFLVPMGGHADIPAALDTIGDHASVSLPWAMFGAAGREARSDRPVWDAYTRRAARPEGVLRNLKSILDPAEIEAVGVHSCRTRTLGWKSAGEDGRVAAPDALKARDEGPTEHLRLNHYYTRSAEEFEAKIARGPGGSADADRYARRLRRAWDLIHADTVEDRALPDYLRRIGAPNDGDA